LRRESGTGCRGAGVHGALTLSLAASLQKWLWVVDSAAAVKSRHPRNAHSRKQTKTRLLPLPTQLSTNRQWWSTPTTQRSHSEQCVEASALSTRQVVHRRNLLPCFSACRYFSARCSSCCPGAAGFRCRGMVMQACTKV